MENFNPQKLTTNFQGITPLLPVLPRRYTLTHSDSTAQLFLTIGPQFSFDKLGPERDEVLAEWHYCGCIVYLSGWVRVDNPENDKLAATKRYKIFNENLPLALTAIRYGDSLYFKCHPRLDYAEIWLHFLSCYPEFNGAKCFGRPIDYIV